MIFSWLIPFLVAVIIITAAYGALKRVSLWRAGRPSNVNILAGLAAIPRRYLVDLHHVVGRDKYMSNTHVATGGGFAVTLIFAVVVYIFNVDNTAVTLVLLGAAALMLVGAIFVYRRRRTPPTRLSKGPWMRLPKSLLIFSSSMFLITLLTSNLFFDSTVEQGLVYWTVFMTLLAGIIYGLVEMVLGMTWGGPMKHAFAGALHLGFHRRSERFGGGRSTGLIPVKLHENSLGVAKPIDFKWNQLLGFDACVQCGRCENVCPAFAAGQPLNPKKLIQDMVVGIAGGTDEKYEGSAYPGIPIGQAKGAPEKVITEGLVKADTLWSCTTCRACVEECPMMIEHVDAVVDMRRYLTLERGETPNKGAETLENLDTTDNPNGFDPASRTNWAADQNLDVMKEVKEVDVLFWVSDGAFDMRSQRILRAFVNLLKAAGVNFAVLGDEELDSGDVARRLGDDATFQRLAVANIGTLKQYKFNKIVTTDPHAFHVLKNEYCDFGGDFEVLHHTTFLNELVKTGKLKLGQYKGGKVTYHDPCYLGRYNDEYDSPRELLKMLGIELAEMDKSKFRSRCCGGGGGAPITDIPGERRIADMRMEDIVETDAELVAVGCQQCTAMLEGVIEPRPQVMDISEIIAITLIE